MDTVDVVVVGAGAAGLSAALFLARARRRTVVYDGGATRNSTTEHVHEYLGDEGMTPSDWLSRGRTEVARYGGDVRSEAVLRIEPGPGGLFEVRGERGTVVSRAVVLATGLVDELPSVPGLGEGWGRDVHVCPCFSGYEVRDSSLVAFGLAERLVQLGSFLTAWSPSVTVVSPHDFGPGDLDRLIRHGVETVPDSVTALVRRDARLVAVATAGGREVPCDAVFVAAPVRAASDLAASICDVDEAGFAITDADGRTSRPGVWAAGNAADPLGHLAQAASEGARVGPWVVDYLLNTAA
jgi:thioredoxin reductase